MTDEEKWYEYCKAKKMAWWTQYDEERAKRIYLDGLAEGRKESAKDINVLTKENKLQEEINRLEKEKTFVNNPAPNIQEEVITLRIENAELKEQIEKMKCCENCKKHRNRDCSEDKKFYARTTKQCNEWEPAE